MPYINYSFADGHSEDIEVSEEVSETYNQILKYEKKVDRKESRRHVSLDMLQANGFEFADPNGDILEEIEKREQERLEWEKEKKRRAKLAKRKRQLEFVLTPRQADAYFKSKYLKIKKTEIAKSLGISEGAVRKLIKKAETNLPTLIEKAKVEYKKELLLLRAIFGPIV